MNYVTLIITVPLTIFAVLFVVSNTARVDFFLYPGAEPYPVAVYFLGILMLGGGFFLGALFVWLHSQRVQFLYWREQRRAARLEKELEGLHTKTEAEESQKLPAPQG